MDKEDVTKLALQAQLEQFAAAMSQVAVGLGDYFCALLRAGFSEEQSFALVLDLQKQLIAGSKGV